MFTMRGRPFTAFRGCSHAKRPRRRCVNIVSRACDGGVVLGRSEKLAAKSFVIVLVSAIVKTSDIDCEYSVSRLDFQLYLSYLQTDVFSS